MKKFVPLLVVLLAVVSLSSCSRLLGYGVLLWSTEDPAIPSGTVLPVYIRSNIDKVWVVGVPEQFRSGEMDKMEIPLPKLELEKNKGAAEKRAEAFAPFALTYAENLQDGLPIRENTDNGARRVYRLRGGEIVKVLEKVKGNAAIGADGSPLPGDWYKVMAEDGTAGYCFSYRLRLFQQEGGALAAQAKAETVEEEDLDLDVLLAKTWSPELYETMVNDGHIDLDAFSKHYGFFPGQDTGIARIYTPDVDRSFNYTGIKKNGNRAWRFDGAQLQMNLRSDTVLLVQYTEESGAMKSLLFVNLTVSADDLAAQETSRREQLYHALFEQGPVFTSNNYGSLDMAGNGAFTWKGFELLVPAVIPADAIGSGTVSMNLFLDKSLQERYSGAFTLNFNTVSGKGAPVHFAYSFDTGGLRIEHIPDSSLSGSVVMRRAASPIVIYFFTGR